MLHFSHQSQLIQTLFILFFAAGCFLIGETFLAKIPKRKLKRPVHLEDASLAAKVELEVTLSDAKRRFLEYRHISGISSTLSYFRFVFIRIFLLLFLVLLVCFINIPQLQAIQILTIKTKLWILFQMLTAAVIGYFIPLLYLKFKSDQKRTEYLLEISDFSHRLTIVMNDETDLRDVIIRASRSTILLKPALHDLIAYWTKDQVEAIWRFKESVGITEIYPLVNALLALSRADKKEIIQVLAEQTKAIDNALENQIKEKLENAPLWLTIVALIPFSSSGILYAYPWLVTAIEQMSVSFSIN